MSIAPEKKQAIMERIAGKKAEQLRFALLTALDSGWLLFAKGKPRERLQGYLQNTLAEDVQLVLDPDYLDKLAAGEAPMLRAVQLVQAREQEQAQLDPATGQPMQAQTPEPPMFWVIILGTLPGYVFEALADDFRKLLRDLDKREAETRIEPYGVVLP